MSSGASKLILVTGGAGFIGSNLVDALLAGNHRVRVIDNFSTGKREFLSQHNSNSSLEIIEADLSDEGVCKNAVTGCDAVFHLAANADVRHGWDHPLLDIQQNTIVTHSLLEACRIAGVRKFVFSSTGSVYGDAKQIPTTEECPFPIQTSLYAASKLAAEGLIGAYAEAGIIDATIFRFVSILGPRYTHGHVYDFVKQLLADPKKLSVLGDGTQTKSYLHVNDCIAALVQSLNWSDSLGIFNLGTTEVVQVRESIALIINALKLSPEILYSGGNQGWIGDNPYILLATDQIRSTGWSTSATIPSSIVDTVNWLTENRWVFD
jgi:UDP-glucose 4-epimerase